MGETERNQKDLKDLLGELDAEEYDPAREDSIRDLLMTGFRGRLRWAGIIVWLDLILFSALAVFTAVSFFAAETVRDQIMYATLFALAMIFIATIKMWYWMLVHRNAIKREVKRLELRIAHLAETLPKT